MSSGKYIVIEGTNGVGKTTQMLSLGERLRAAGLATKVFSELSSQSDLAAKKLSLINNDPRYLINDRSEVLLTNAARSQSIEIIRKSIENGVYCLCDKSFLSMLINQYYGNNAPMDYDLLNQLIGFSGDNIEPDLTIVMDAPLNLLIQRRLHSDSFSEIDESYIERVRAGYLWEANQRQYPIVFSTKSIEETANEIWKLATPVIANRASSNLILDKPASIKEIITERIEVLGSQAKDLTDKNEVEDSKSPVAPEITDKNYEYLSKIVTSTTDNIYTFTDELNPIMISASIANLSQYRGDIRSELLKNFSQKPETIQTQAQKPSIHSNISTLKKLVRHDVVIEGVSCLTVSKIKQLHDLEWSSQPFIHADLDQKDPNGHYKYIVPNDLNSSVRKIYTQKINTIFSNYVELVAKLTDYIASKDKSQKKDQTKLRLQSKQQAIQLAQRVLPLATKSTIAVNASVKTIEKLIANLGSDEVAEANAVADKIFSSLKLADLLNFGSKSSKNNTKVSQDRRFEFEKKLDNLLPSNYVNGDTSVNLIGFSPRNEFDLIIDALYGDTNLSYSELQKQIGGWDMKRKTDIFTAFMSESNKSMRALEKAHYSWDLLCDFLSFNELLEHKPIEAIIAQASTPIYGFETPKLIEDANLTDLFQDCFRESVELYSNMQQAGYLVEAQYATLVGHKQRFQLTVNAQLMSRLTGDSALERSENFVTLVQDLTERLSEVHPLIGESIKSKQSD